ncbi:hypothetical protein ABK040_006810 [Willaertia magna]
MSDIDMDLLLNDFWKKTELPTIIKEKKDASYFLGKDRDSKIIPKLENTFRALNEMTDVKECKVVIFGQDPYPREESAVGIAFFDGEITKYTDSFSPSFRNIIKNVLYSFDELEKSDKVDTLRKTLKKLNMIDPPEWFNETMKQNVLWLNTALTYESKEGLDKHTTFWKPIIEEILNILLKNSSKGIVFVLWGGHAKKLKTVINKIAKKLSKSVAFVEANHPAVESFHDVKTFSKINEELKKLGHDEIDWIIKKNKRDNEETTEKKTTKKKK